MSSHRWVSRVAGWAPLALVLLAFGLYGNALRNPYLIDDLDAIQSHPDVVSPDGWRTLWGRDYWAGRSPEDPNLYRPLTILSYHLNARVTGLSPIGFRVVNILLLAGVGICLGLWLHRQVGPGVAWLAAAVWVAHPIHATVINNVVGRADLLAVLGVVGFLAVQREALVRGRWPGWAVGLGLIAAVVAVGAKETGLLVLPTALVQWHVFGRPQPHLRPTLLIAAAPVLLWALGRIAVSGLAVKYGPSTSDLTGNPLASMDLLERLPTALALVWTNLRQIIAPTLQHSYLPDALPGWLHPATWLGLIALVGTSAGLVAALKRRHELATVVTFALGQCLLVGNLLLGVGVYTANRLMLPYTLALVVTLVFATTWLVNWKPVARQACLAAALLAIMLGSIGAWVQNRHWSSLATLMQANLDRQPDNTRAMFLLGTALALRNDHAQAQPLLERAVERHPQSSQARHQLAITYLRRGRTVDAMEQYDTILQRGPDVRALSQRAALALAQEDLPTAARHLAKAEQLAPTNPAVMHNLAVLAVLSGRLNDAVLRYEALLREYPEHVPGRAEYDELRQELRRNNL